MSSIEQHDTEIQRNRAVWEEKPLLRTIYADFYAGISAYLREDIAGKIVELGSGIGNFKQVCPQATATDLFPNPWIDQVENAYRLSFANDAVSNLVLFDVFHHLEYPGLAFRELERVVPKSGRVIIFEPYISLFGLFVYGLLHPEPIALMKKISWIPTTTEYTEAYYSAQGNATRIFSANSSYASELKKEWRVVIKKKFSALSYILSGGFSRPALYPESFLPIIRAVERVLNLFPSIFATRVLIILEKR